MKVCNHLITFTLMMGFLSLSSCQQDKEIIKVYDYETLYTKSTIQTPKSRGILDNWAQYQTHDEMVEALQIDKESLREYTTANLVYECLTYPMAFDCFAFNDINQGLESVMANFNGFQELESRDDAVQELVFYYNDYLNNIESLELHSPDQINSLEYAFVELVLSCGKFGDISQDTQINSLFDISEGLINRLSVLSGSLCETAHNLLRTSLYGQQISRTSSFEYAITIYTVNGWAVDAIKRVCTDNSQENSNGLDYINNTYPNATIVKEASCTYNCHAYAWYMSAGGEDCWINCGSSLTSPTNVSKFWQDGTYRSCTQSEAERVFYAYDETTKKGDHSAIVITENLYESKWGSYQVVRHAPDYCPYGSSRKYFTSQPKIDPGYSGGIIYSTVYWDSFPDPTPIGTTEDFWIDNTWDPDFFRTESYVGKAKDPDEPLDDTTCYAIVSRSNNSMSVTFNKQGIYYVCFRVYHIATGQLQASYTSEEIYVQ